MHISERDCEKVPEETRLFLQKGADTDGSGREGVMDSKFRDSCGRDFGASGGDNWKTVDDKSDDETTMMESESGLTWEKKAEYILSNIGYCVGLGNVWRFPYVCIRNGGGAFLIPFFVCLTLCAMPLFFLEASIGQYSGRGPYGVWANICPLFKGIGIAMNFLCLMVVWYYSMILAWTLIYLVNSCKATLPWTLCGQDWNTDHCITSDFNKTSSGESVTVPESMMDNVTWANLNHTASGFLTNQTEAIFSVFVNGTTNSTSADNGSTVVNTTTSSSEEFWLYNVLDISSGLGEMGGVPWHTVTALVVSNICILLGVIKGIKSSGKVVYVTATLPYVLLTLLIIRGCLLPGAMDGLAFYIMPDIEKLFRLQTWLEASIQVFYSLGPTYGCIITMASYNRFNNNCMRDSVLLAFACEGTSVFAGFAIFSVLGHMAYTADVPVGNFSTSGAGLAFVVYPQAIALLPLPQIWGVLFFLMLFSLGLDTQFCNVETVMTSALDAWPRLVSRHRTLLTSLMVFVVTLASIPLTARGGMYIFQLVDWYIATFSVLFIGALECFVVSWLYGAERIFKDIETMMGRRPPLFFSLAWKVFTPTLLLLVLAGTLSSYEAPKYGSYRYSAWGIFIGWNFAIISFLPIPICALWQIYKANGTIGERLLASCQPTKEWAPSLKGMGKFNTMTNDSEDWKSHSASEHL